MTEPAKALDPAELRRFMASCLVEKDGRLLATDAGAEKLRGYLQKHGLVTRVVVVDGKFDLIPYGSKRNASEHVCHWPNCKKPVPPKMWGCRDHWFQLPQELRNKIWRAYKPGQEIAKNPSPEYIAVAHEVQTWIANRRK